MSKENLRRIILNGDDFGFSKGVNRGVLDSIEEGILTSTSVMVYRPRAEEARALANLANVSVGLHLDFTEENPLQRWSKLLYILTWPEQKIRDEFKRQTDRFHSIVGHIPDHIDSHHHVHWLTRFRHVVKEFAVENKIPVRCVDATFEMGFYGRSFTKWDDRHRVTPERLIRVIEELKPGAHEIVCHPGYVDQELRDMGTLYLDQREDEVKALTSPKVKDFILENKDTIKIVSWKDI